MCVTARRMHQTTQPDVTEEMHMRNSNLTTTAKTTL
jgi:hypothetical protein